MAHTSAYGVILRALVLALPLSVTHAQQPARAVTGAAAGAPNTDVWLSRISRRAGAVTVLPPVNLTRRDGYDNQPSFDARGRTLYYTRRAPNAL
ncbi:MAG TPA: hypothetical protein VE861_16445, partial [Gemmatimonadaceae bacterium]|nr:hypothetical protein [Gemmatimonadaceae bacterium]